MHSKNRFAMIILIFAAMFLIGAKPYMRNAEEGKVAYEEGRYRESAEHFTNALESGGDPDIMEYNLGNAQYKLGEYGDAESSYRKALGEKGEANSEYYNLGNALSMQADAGAASGDLPAAKDFFQRAVEAYGKALEYDYTDADTIHNLEYAKRRLKELEEQEPSGGDDSESGESQDDNGESRGKDREMDDSSGAGDSQQPDKSEGAEDGQNKDESSKGDDSRQDDSKQNADGKPPKDDGLKYTDEYIDYLLKYFEEKERGENQQGITIPLIPDDTFQGGFWDQFFAKPPDSDEDWVDW